MLGTLLDVIKEGKSLHSSYGEEGYCEEVFLSTVQKFVNEVKESSNNIGELANEALASHEEAMQQNFHNTDSAESVNLERDPGIRKGMKLTENEKQYLICQGPYQPRFKKYPTNPAISKTKQNAFSPKWYEKFPYLEYSPTTDRAFCFACCLFGDGAGSTDTNWSTEGVTVWNKMKSRGKKRPGKLEEHFTSASHKLSAEKFQCFSQRDMHVDVALNSARLQRLAQEEQERLHARKVITLLLDCTRCLVRQSIAFRGSDDDSNGNFRQIIAFIARWVPFLEHWMSNAQSRSHHVTYLSPKSQNEFVGLLGSEVRQHMVDEIKSSGAYAAMADTTSDVSHLDQISLVIRYVDAEFEIHERLVKISEIKGKSGDAFALKVIQMLNDLQIPLSMARFQCYDTTASMSGAYNGAQAKFSEHLERNIPYITCMGHKANLCVEHCCQASLLIDKFFTTLQDLYNFLTKSTSRFGKLKDKIEELQEGLIMKNLSKTRWIGRAESIRAVWLSYEVLLDVLAEIENFQGSDRDARKTANDLLERIQSFDFYFCMLFTKSIMYKMKVVILEVQEIDYDILASLDAMCETRDEMLRIRNDDVGLDGIITAAVEKCSSFGIDVQYEFSKKHRPRRQPRRIDENADNRVIPHFNQHYRQEMFKVLDRLVSDINDAHNYVSDIVVPVSVLLPNKIAKCTANQVEQLCAAFPEDLQDPDALLAEMDIIGGAIEQSEAKNMREAARFLKEKRFFYPALAKAYQLALTIPISVASNGRSFSKLRLVKNYLRSTMKEDRLDSLMILASSPDILDNVDIDKIADSWSNLKARRVKL